ncbi:MAG: hypothetical protein LW822_09780 [Phycisphaeraceae bacterium]|nr:hypothetical protein [Phycisphaeraceae bacterium]
MTRTLTCLLALGALALQACEEKAPLPMPQRSGTPAPQAPSQPAAAAPAQPPALAPAPNPPQADIGAFTVGGINLRVPPGWKPVPVASTPFAPVADLRFASPAGEARAAFFVVEGGGKDANLQRWQRQMTGVREPLITISEIAGLAVTRIDMLGEYRGMTPTGAAAPPVPNTRFVGVIIEGAARPVQVRITGPKEAVDAGLPSLDAMLGQMTMPK